MSAESQRHVEAVVAALQLLEAFESDVGLRASDLQERTSLQYSRVMRLTGTLVSRGFLVLDQDSGRYFLGPGLFRLGLLTAPRYANLSERVRPILGALVAETGMTAMFSITDGVSRLVLCKQEPPTTLRYTVSEGQSRPIAAGASGRVMLAFGPRPLRESALEGLGPAEREALTERLDAVRAAGNDVSISELTRDAFAVACPSLAPDGELIGVLTLAGPSGGFTEARQRDYVQLLQRNAPLISAPVARPMTVSNS